MEWIMLVPSMVGILIGAFILYLPSTEELESEIETEIEETN